MNTPEYSSTDTAKGHTAGDLSSRIGQIASLMAREHYPAADRAALRRYSPGQPLPLAFYRLWLRHLGIEPPSGNSAADWALITWGLATSGGASHQRNRSLGRCLAETGYSEARLERLLAASDEDMRQALVASLVRFVSAKGAGFDWVQLAQLVLTQDVDSRERLHQRIASDYYRHPAATTKE
jgi:CRISPR system Cascade subunit CasB